MGTYSHLYPNKQTEVANQLDVIASQTTEATSKTSIEDNGYKKSADVANL